MQKILCVMKPEDLARIMTDSQCPPYPLDFSSTQVLQSNTPWEAVHLLHNAPDLIICSLWEPCDEVSMTTAQFFAVAKERLPTARLIIWTTPHAFHTSPIGWDIYQAGGLPGLGWAALTLQLKYFFEGKAGFPFKEEKETPKLKIACEPPPEAA